EDGIRDFHVTGVQTCALPISLFASQGISFAAQFICTHRPEDRCSCRKPAIGLVRDFVNAAPLDRERSAMVGDSDSDVEFALNLEIGRASCRERVEIAVAAA